MTNTLRNRNSAPDTESDDSFASLIKRESSKDRVPAQTSADIAGRAVAYFHQRSPQCKVLLTAVALWFSFLSFVYMLDAAFTYYGYSSFPNSPVFSDHSFAVVINTYKRPEMLQQAVRHYADTCGRDYGVAQVFIVWAELNVQPPQPHSFFQSFHDDTLENSNKVNDDVANPKRSSVSIIRVPKDSLNSRFLPIKDIQSNGLFMVDDDVRVNCKALFRAFQAWTFHPYAMTGFYPRLATPPLFNKNLEAPSYIYHTWPVLYLHSTFNIILTKAAFLHKDYLDIYSDSTQHPWEIQKHVDESKNCEDIAMAFLIANRTRVEALHELSIDRKPYLRKSNPTTYCSHCPVYVQGDVSDLGLFNGISTQSKGGLQKLSGHMGKRNECIDTISKIYLDYGWEYPLFDLSLTQHSWTHHFPGFWWQQKPSNVFEWLSFGNTFK